MTMAQYALARFSKQLRTELNTRELTETEAVFLNAVERDIVRWQELREEQNDQTQQVLNARRQRTRHLRAYARHRG